MDTIFKALNDPARRALLDSLRQRDGQTLSELEEQLDMTRFGVMKHLKVLEDAHLIVTRRQGRFKHHYLNALPLQEMLDRWIAPFLQPQARALSDLKSRLERENRMGKPDFMMQTFIRCTQDALWDALTRADQMAVYHFMCNEVHGDALPGNVTRFVRPDGADMLKQVTTEMDPKSRIAMTFEPVWMGEGAHRELARGLPDRAAGRGLQADDRALRHRALRAGRLRRRLGPSGGVAEILPRNRNAAEGGHVKETRTMTFPTELGVLTCLTLLAASLWIPYIIGVNRHLPEGVNTFQRPHDGSSLPDWVMRANRAHINLLEQGCPSPS
jgi:DNA-binding transcriptional ArsR family regulator/uncharacterized protein YndB with AHSA1/START domain